MGVLNKGTQEQNETEGLPTRFCLLHFQGQGGGMWARFPYLNPSPNPYPNPNPYLTPRPGTDFLVGLAADGGAGAACELVQYPLSVHHHTPLAPSLQRGYQTLPPPRVRGAKGGAWDGGEGVEDVMREYGSCICKSD